MAFSMREKVPEPVLCNGWWEVGGDRVDDVVIVVLSSLLVPNIWQKNQKPQHCISLS